MSNTSRNLQKPASILLVMNRVIHFEIPADDIDRAAEFYRKVFDWDIKDSGMPDVEYFLITTGEGEIGINGGLMRRKGSAQTGGENAFVCTVQVENLDESIGRVRQNGCSTVGEKMQIPNVGAFVYCLDTESNTFSMLEPVSQMI